MPPKRLRESSEPAAGGAKRLRIDKDTDENPDEDEEMFDAALDSEKNGADDAPAPDAAGEEAGGGIKIHRIQLEDLDYDDMTMAQDLVYDNNGRTHPGYGDKSADPNQAVPKGPIIIPPPPPTVSKSESSAAKLEEKKAKEKEKIVKLFQDVKRLHGDWIGVEGQLGDGGQGCARLFVRVDDQHRITERVVIKDSWSRFHWDDGDWWEKGRFRCDPRESITHKLLTLQTPERWERHLVQYIGHSINPTWQVSRTYMEFCEGGDLEDLMSAQNRRCQYTYTQSITDSEGKKVSESEVQKVMKAPAGERVPEPFVWYYLKQMAIALHRMENIPLKRYRRNLVVHQDIKPPNIFMTNPDPTEFPKYPICKIGDFGSARITYEMDTDNPSWNDPITYGYVAPEMAWLDTYESKMWEMGTATNVWQIAMTIVTLMRLKKPDKIDYDEQDLDEEYMDLLYDLELDYTDELTELLRQMLCTDPGNRPTPKEILKFFYANEGSWKEMSTAPSCDDIDLHPSWLHWSPNEKLQINNFFVEPSSDDEDDEDDDEDPKTVGNPGK